MKYIIALVTLLSFVWVGCSNEIELTEDKVETPVMYGLLDQKDDFHYIRLERVFLDKSISALEIAKNPDSLYYAEDGATVTITNLTKGISVEMLRVNAEDENINRNDGAFASSPNVLYKASQTSIQLETGDQVQVEAVINENTKASATTTIIGSPNFRIPNEASQISFNPDRRSTMSLNDGEHSKIHSMRLDLNVTEFNGSNTKSVSIPWPIIINSEKTESTVENKEFYSLLSGSLEVSSSINRIFEGVDITITSGGQEILDYYSVNQANLGITSSGEVPTYNNIEGGYGLLSSVSSISATDLTLKGDTQNWLKTVEQTKDLNFR